MACVLLPAPGNMLHRVLHCTSQVQQLLASYMLFAGRTVIIFHHSSWWVNRALVGLLAVTSSQMNNRRPPWLLEGLHFQSHPHNSPASMMTIFSEMCEKSSGEDKLCSGYLLQSRVTIVRMLKCKTSLILNFILTSLEGGLTMKLYASALAFLHRLLICPLSR